VYFRLLRNDLIATLQEDFITMARSKGMTDRRILLKHAFRPSSVSLLASAGINIGALIAGTFVVEYLLQIPGLGYELVTAINQTDYIVVQSIVLVVAIAVVIINFIVTSCSPWSTRGLLVSESAVPYEPIEATTSCRPARPAPRSVARARPHRGQRAAQAPRLVLLGLRGWIVLVILLAVFAALLPLPNPNYPELRHPGQRRAECRPLVSGSTT